MIDEKVLVGMQRYVCGCEREKYGDYTLGNWKKLCKGHREDKPSDDLIPLIECWICQNGTPARYVRDLEDHEEVLCEGCVIDTGILYENGVLNEKEAEELCFRKITKQEFSSGEVQWGLFWKQELQKQKFDNLKLKMVAIPTMLVNKSLQKILSSKYWNIIRDKTLEEYGNKCTICQHAEGKLHCHEVWEYDDENLIQKLKKCIILCTRCHNVAHPRMVSFESKKGNIDIEKVKEHFMKINECDEDVYNAYRDYILELEMQRTCQEQEWKIDYGKYSNMVKESNIQKEKRKGSYPKRYDR